MLNLHTLKLALDRIVNGKPADLEILRELRNMTIADIRKKQLQWLASLANEPKNAPRRMPIRPRQGSGHITATSGVLGVSALGDTVSPDVG